MNFEKYYINGKAVINLSDKSFKIPKGVSFETNGWRQMSKELDRFLYSYYKADLFDNCRINESALECLKCVIIMLDNILAVIDERNVDYRYWNEILIEANDLKKELE